MPYDRSVLIKYAARLYRQANMVVLVWLMIGAIAGVILNKLLPSRTADPALVIIVGAGIGIVIGISRAFMLKVEAQRILCQVEIETHLESLKRQADLAPTKS